MAGKAQAIRKVLEWLTKTMDTVNIPGWYDDVAHKLVDVVLLLVPKKELTGPEKKATASDKMAGEPELDPVLVGTDISDKTPELVQGAYDAIKEASPELLKAGNGEPGRVRP